MSNPTVGNYDLDSDVQAIGAFISEIRGDPKCPSDDQTNLDIAAHILVGLMGKGWVPMSITNALIAGAGGSIFIPQDILADPPHYLKMENKPLLNGRQYTVSHTPFANVDQQGSGLILPPGYRN